MAMNDSEKARIAGRKEAVKAGAAKGLSGKESRKRYYVQTRVAELEKAGKPVSAEKRKQLRQKFNSGNISRKGFAAPKKKTGSSNSSSDSTATVTPTPSVSVRRMSGANAAAGSRASAPSRDTSRNRMEGRGAYGPKGKTTGVVVGGHPRGAAGRTIKKVLGGLGSMNGNRANPSRVSQSAARNRAAKAKKNK